MKCLSGQALSFIIWKLNLPRDLKIIYSGKYGSWTRFELVGACSGSQLTVIAFFFVR